MAWYVGRPSLIAVASDLSGFIAPRLGLQCPTRRRAGRFPTKLPRSSRAPFWSWPARCSRGCSPGSGAPRPCGSSRALALDRITCGPAASTASRGARITPSNRRTASTVDDAWCASKAADSATSVRTLVELEGLELKLATPSHRTPSDVQAIHFRVDLRSLPHAPGNPSRPPPTSVLGSPTCAPRAGRVRATRAFDYTCTATLRAGRYPAWAGSPMSFATLRRLTAALSDVLA